MPPGPTPYQPLWGGGVAPAALSFLGLFFMAVPAAHSQAQPRSQAAPAALERTVWVCDVAYTPTRSNWSREVRLGYDTQRLHTVDIDGVRVYTFAVADTLILTSLDNERIRIDVGARTWSSDFRGLAEGQGRCEPADAAR